MKNAHFNFALLLFCLLKEKVSPFAQKKKKEEKVSHFFPSFLTLLLQKLSLSKNEKKLHTKLDFYGGENDAT